VTNSEGSSTSAPVTLSVVAPVLPIVSQATTPGVVTVFTGGMPSFYAAFGGSSPFRINGGKLWIIRTTPTSPGHQHDLLLTDVQLTDAGYYACGLRTPSTRVLQFRAEMHNCVCCRVQPFERHHHKFGRLDGDGQGRWFLHRDFNVSCLDLYCGLGAAPFNLATDSGADNEGSFRKSLQLYQRDHAGGRNSFICVAAGGALFLKPPWRRRPTPIFNFRP